MVSIDPEGTETAYKFDDLSRRVAVVEARSDVDPAEDITWDNTGGLWDVAWPMSAPPDQDRVTTFVYDGISNVIKRVAHLNDDTTQITQYTYGTSEPVASPGSMDSLVASSRLLDTVAYPDESTGAPGTTDAYKVSYAYNIQGELIGMTDQNGTLHTYDRDGLGRVTDDRVADYDDQATYPIAVDVRRISADFDDHGRLEDVRTYNAATGGDEVNFVGFEYNTLHQVTAVAQNHDSATPSAEEEVEYDYTASPAVGSGNHSRITAMRYPAEAGGSTATVEYTYDTGIDNTISRVSSIDQPGITGALAAYTYLGQGMVTKVLYEHLDVRLDRKIRPDASTVTGATVFPGFDRFGRIDLGLGRAPGTDQATARALRRTLSHDSADSFPQDVEELQAYFDEVRPGQRVRAVPGAGLKVPLWLLGSSLFGAQLAAAMGLPFAFASHFAPGFMRQAIDLYRRTFRPSEQLDRPHVMLGLNVFAAETDAEARHLFSSLQQQFLALVRGTPGQLKPPVDDIERLWDASEAEHIRRSLACSVVGDPAAVREGIQRFVDDLRPDELMLTGQIYDHAARLRSFEIAADAMRALQPASSQTA